MQTLRQAGHAPGTLLDDLAQYTSAKLLSCLGPGYESNLSYVLVTPVILAAIVHSLMRDIHSANTCWLYILNEVLNLNKETGAKAD